MRLTRLKRSTHSLHLHKQLPNGAVIFQTEFCRTQCRFHFFQTVLVNLRPSSGWHSHKVRTTQQSQRQQSVPPEWWLMLTTHAAHLPTYNKSKITKRLLARGGSVEGQSRMVLWGRKCPAETFKLFFIIPRWVSSSILTFQCLSPSILKSWRQFKGGGGGVDAPGAASILSLPQMNSPHGSRRKAAERSVISSSKVAPEALCTVQAQPHLWHIWVMCFTKGVLGSVPNQLPKNTHTHTRAPLVKGSAVLLYMQHWH